MLVFISHSARDRWIATQLDRDLRNIPGVETFLDENDIQGGDRIAERVRSEMTRCDEVVILFSTASQQSDWVKAEIGAAWVLGKRITSCSTNSFREIFRKSSPIVEHST